MALIKCSKCGSEISGEASFCPKCGCPVAGDCYFGGNADWIYSLQVRQ
ncbi:zinc-ribbon domain-containing protein [Eisenbergiella porci]|uniref:Zinc ribbon domain-containing protein n=1 Tax=Eisenbergiella porci TaxID=2652274 RepID=A0A6N7W6P7_9FIRM|nr:zinc ribbon domain-containing protein [Eisenbergiella porci]